MHFELLISTRKGLVIGRSKDRDAWSFGEPMFSGWQVDYAVRDSRNNRIWAAVSHMQWGPHLHFSDDDGASWSEAPAPEFQGESYSVSEYDVANDEWLPAETVEGSLARIWTIEPGPVDRPEVLYAGIDPAALFVSEDNGLSWSLNRSLWEHRTRGAWVPGAAGLVMHHIQVDPRNSSHLYVEVSAAGVFKTTDGGSTWEARNAGCVAEHLPNPEPEAGQCVHSLHLHPADTSRLFQQHHPGVYRSDDGGAHWIDIAAGLPGEFGFASTIDPHDADTFFVIPLQFDQARIPEGGRLRVYRTRDAGASWEGLSAGLPQDHVLQGVYRQALCQDGAGEDVGLGVYLGTSGGHVYASRDGGDQWSQLLEHLAPVTALRASVLAEQFEFGSPRGRSTRFRPGPQPSLLAALDERSAAVRVALTACSTPSRIRRE